MTSKFLKKLVDGTLVIVFCSVSVKAGFPQSAAPYLSFKFSGENNQRGKSPQNPAILKRSERLEFQIQYVTNAPYRPSRGIDYGPLSIRAVNQHPDYFKERPGPTVSLEVMRTAQTNGSNCQFAYFLPAKDTATACIICRFQSIFLSRRQSGRTD